MNHRLSEHTLPRVRGAPIAFRQKKAEWTFGFVEHTLKGNTDQLKERAIGIEVFGRGVEYDTASDPIVRVTAAEIRKRIAQYYAVPEHQNQLRVSLPSGP